MHVSIFLPVEANPVVEAPDPRVLSHDGLVIGGKALRAAHSALDPDLVSNQSITKSFH